MDDERTWVAESKFMFGTVEIAEEFMSIRRYMRGIIIAPNVEDSWFIGAADGLKWSDGGSAGKMRIEKKGSNTYLAAGQGSPQQVQ